MHKINLVVSSKFGKWLLIDTRGPYPAALTGRIGQEIVTLRTVFRGGEWKNEVTFLTNYTKADREALYGKQHDDSNFGRS